MTPQDLFPLPDDPLDAAVRRHLEERAAQVDVHALLQKLDEAVTAVPNLASPQVSRPRSRRGTLTALLACGALAAGVLLAIMVSPPAQTAIAAPTPAETLRAARAALRDEERTYSISIRGPEWVNHLLERFKPKGERTLRVRGHQFVETAFGGNGAWGRNEQGQIWFTPDHKVGVFFTSEELPPKIRQIADFHTLELDTLLEQAASQFQLSWSDSEDGRWIEAVRTDAGRPYQIVSVRVKVDPETNTIEHLILQRKITETETVHVTFHLKASEPASSQRFDLKSHLEPTATVYGPDRKLLRLGALKKIFGDKWITRD